MSDWNAAARKAIEDGLDNYFPSDGDAVDFMLKQISDAGLQIVKRPAEQEGGWMPIESAPSGDELFLAACADGRIMIVRGSILVSMRNPRTPDHLQFPATHWQPLPAPPHKAAGDR